MSMDSPQLDSQVEKSPSAWQAAMARLRKNRLAMLAYRVLLFLALVALLADFLAYNKPLHAVYKGQTYYPVVYDYLADWGLYSWEADLVNVDWRELDLESATWPPVRYKPEEPDYDNQRALSPFGKQRTDSWKEWHFLGTDRDGRDVLSGLIHGSRISLTIGVVAMSIAAFVGIIVGAFAGFFGDNRLKLSWIGIFALGIGIILGYFYAFQVRGPALHTALMEGASSLIFQFLLSLLIFAGVMISVVVISKPLDRLPFLGNTRYVWVDLIVSRIIEIFQSIPSLILIITIMSVTEEKNIYLIMIVLGLLSWPSIARYMRGEMLRTRQMEYIQAARSLGFREWRIVFRHAIPNSLAPVLVVLAFGVAGAITAEASLSFIGIGVPDEVVTWGKLLKEANKNVSAWWLSVFPGFAIFLTVTSLNLLGEGLRDAFDPKTE